MNCGPTYHSAYPRRHYLSAVILITLISCFSSVHAQYFSKRMPLLAHSNGYISSIQIVNDTIYAICNVIDTVPPYYPIASFNIYDKSGNRVSYNPFNIAGRSTIGVNMNTLIRTNDGGFAYGGWTWGTSSTQNSILLLKYDHFGNLEWYKELPDTNYSTFYCNAIVQDSLSNYYLAVNFTYPSTNKFTVLIAKTDSAGNLIYKKEFPHPNYDCQASSICLNTQGHLILSGSALFYNYLNFNTLMAYKEVYELDTAGNQLNYVIGTDTNGPAASNMLVTNDGGYLIASSYICYRDVNDSKWRGCVSKLDSAFHEIWRIDAGPCSQFTDFLAQRRCPDGNYIAVGEWYDETDTIHSHKNGWILKYTEDGHILWNKLFRGITSNQHQGDENIFLTLGFLSDSSIICAGEAVNYDDTINGQQGWLLHLDTAGCLPDSNSCGIISAISTISSPSPIAHLYPNPTSRYFTIDLPSEQSAITIIITDLLGQTVYQSTIPLSATQLSIDAQAWHSGSYYCILHQPSGTTQTLRLIKD